jgi:hypothetical protein
VIAGGRRAANGVIGLRVPADMINAKCSRYTARGKPAHRPWLKNETDHAIISRYGAEYRGIVQYYLLAGDVYRLNRLRWVMATSLLKTLAGKYDSSVSKMAHNGPQVPGHDRHAARDPYLPSSQRGSRQGPQTTGRNVRRYPATTTAQRGHHRPRTNPTHGPRQPADPSAAARAVRSL